MRLLSLLLYVPGRRAVQGVLLPLALGGATLYTYSSSSQTYFTAKADSGDVSHPSSSSAAVAAAAGSSKGGARHGEQPGAGTSSLSSLVSRMLGSSNEFANGGLTLMLVGAAAAGARVVLGSALRYCKRHVMVQAEVDSRDDAYRWLMHWLSQNPRFMGRATNVSITTNLTGTFGTSIPAVTSAVATAAGGAADGPPVTFLPAPGDHLMRYRGRWMLISRQRNSGNPQLAANARLLMETLRISMLGTNRGPLEELIAEAASAYNASQACRTAVHSVDQDGYWTQVGSRPVRPMHTVVLPQGQADSLLADCQEFLASEDFYAHHGIPFRRGYLLYGPPGTGKTSCVMALAGALGLEIYVVTLSSPTMTDETLRHLLNTAGTRSILLLEDVDAAFVDRSATQGTARLTFSGLLNAIDGVAAQEGRLLFMTTNHIERLNPALIRPGRVDVKCQLGLCSTTQARAMFVSFYRDLPMQLVLRAPPQDAGTGGKVSAAAQETELQPLLVPPPQQQSRQLQPDSGRSMSLLRRQQAEAADAKERDAALQVLADKFVSRLPQEPAFSTAQLQAYLMQHRLAPEQAVEGVEQWLQGMQQSKVEEAESQPGQAG